MGLLELRDLRHKVVDIGTTLLCISDSCFSGVVLCINSTLPYSLHENTRP